MKLSAFLGLVTLSASLVLVASSCNKKKADAESDEQATGTDTSKVGTVNITTSALAEAIYPAGMNVTAFPTVLLDDAKVVKSGDVGIETDGKAAALMSLLDGPDQACQQRYQVDVTGRIFSDGDVSKQSTGNVDPSEPCKMQQQALHLTDEEATQNPQQKSEAEEQLLSGTATECLTSAAIRQLSNQQPDGGDGCYQFDYGIMQGNSCQQPEEVCMVKTARGIINGGAAQIEGGLGITQAMLCQAKKDGKAEALPAIGETLDLTTNLQTATAGRDDAPTISSAKITRLPDANGQAIYKTTLALTTKDGKAVEFNLAHAPGATSEAYNGVMWIKRNQPNGQQGATGISALSVRYDRTGTGADARLKMDVLSADMAAEFTPFATTGELSFPAGDNLGNDKLSSATRYSFNVNPETTEGQIALWKNPGGNYNERARGFVFEVAYDADAKALKGCGVAGADETSIRAEIANKKALSPTAVYTPSICRADGKAGPNDNVSATVWKQCFTQNTSGVYVVDSTKTTHASGFDYLPAADGGLTPPAVSFSTSLGDVNQ